MSKPLIIELPYAPSVNHYWGVHGKRRYIKKQGLLFRENVLELAGNLPKLIGKMATKITAFPPDNRRRDLDNLIKATLDALQHAGLYKDDTDFEDIQIVRGKKFEGGKLEIKIWELE